MHDMDFTEIGSLVRFYQEGRFGDAKLRKRSLDSTILRDYAAWTGGVEGGDWWAAGDSCYRLHQIA